MKNMIQKNFLSIMILDDEEIVRNDIRTLINWEKYGYQIVAEAGSASEALRFLKLKEIQIVIADIEMPVMNGLDFANEALKINKKMKFIFLTAYNDFNYVRSSMRLGANSYILKHEIDETTIIEELERARHELLKEEQIEFFFFNEVMEKFLSEQNDSNEMLQFVINNKIPMKDGSSCFIKILIESREQRYSEKKIIAKIINDISKEDKYIKCVVFSMEEDILSAMIAVDEMIENQKLYLMSFLNSIQNRIYMALQRQNYILVSQWIADMRQVQKHYCQTMKIYDLPYIYNTPKIVYLNENENYSRKIAKQMKEFAVACERQDYNRAVKEYIVISEMLPMLIDRKYIQKVIADVISIILKYDQENEEHNYREYKKEIWEWNYCDTMRWVQNFLEQVALRKAKTLKDRIQIIEQYIMKNYDKDISLESLAEIFEVTESYMSQLFKSCMGNSFKNYLRNIRMSKAKQFLENGYSRINVIARKTGYSSTAYFCTVFKQYYGVTPSEYIEILEKR